MTTETDVREDDLRATARTGGDSEATRSAAT
jgi:hypothetical protein